MNLESKSLPFMGFQRFKWSTYVPGHNSSVVSLIDKLDSCKFFKFDEFEIKKKPNYHF